MTEILTKRNMAKDQIVFTEISKPIKLKKNNDGFFIFHLLIAYSGTFQKMSHTASFNSHENAASPSLTYT